MFTRITSALMRRSYIIILAVSCFIGVFAALTGVTMGIDAKTQKLREKVMAKNATGDIMIVAIDDKSIKEMQAWPWPRSTHGQLAETLVAAGAEHVVFDVSFVTPAADPKQDALFAQSLARVPGKVSLFAINDLNEGAEYDALPIEPLLKEAAPAAGWISVRRHDEVINLPREMTISGMRMGTLSTQLAGVPFGGENYEPDWAIRYLTIPVISYSDVINGRIPDEQLRGKRVIVGATAQTFGDQWTAADGYRISGVFIHALGAETLRANVPTPIGPYGPLALMVAVLAICLMLRNRLIASTLMVVAYGGIIVIGWFVQEQSGYVSSVAPAGIALLTAVLIQFVASISAIIMQRLTTDPITNLPNLAGMEIADPEGTTVAVRLHNHLETVSVLGSDLSADLMRRVRDRIRLAAGDSQIYQVDEQSFAWRTLMKGTQLSEAIEGLTSVFASGVPLDGRVIDTPISAGIAEDHPGPVQESVAAALLAAEHAVRQGLPWTRHVDASADAEWRLTMMGELEVALRDGDVWVAYQPKWNAQDTSQCIGAEALVRWTHPVRGPIRPDQFIPILEEGGRIDGLTSYVLDIAVRDFAPLQDMGIAVNLSTRLLGKGKIVQTVRHALDAYDMPADRLTLEITESASLDGDESIRELEELVEMGVKISIDDYGTGQSTLTYVRRLPATELKVDQSFVRAMLTSRSDELMIASTIVLSHQLGLDVVAEGVETQAEADALAKLGCDVLQGYHLGRPVPLTEFLGKNAISLVKKRKRA